jgi:hypothetical protein
MRLVVPTIEERPCQDGPWLPAGWEPVHWWRSWAARDYRGRLWVAVQAGHPRGCVIDMELEGWQ